MKTLRSRAAALWLAAIVLPFSAHAELIQVSNLFVFGDSLSDGGNSGLLTQQFAGDPSVVFPPPPYAGGRVSNGPVMVEYLWNHYNAGQPFAPSLAGGTNFAIGGATSGTANFNSVDPIVPAALQPAYTDHGLASQLAQFQQYETTHPAFDPATSLFIVWIFPNDVFYTDVTGDLPGAIPGSPGGSNLIENGIANILTAVQTLASLGAEHIVVANLPNLADAPEFLGSPEAAQLDQFSQLFNANLAAQLDQLDALLAAEIVQFDVDAAFQEILANPANYGFTNTTDACVQNLANGQCDPGSWVFWDGVHPTTYTHQVLTTFLLDQLSVPEPASALLMLAGLAALAGARRVTEPV